MNMQGMDHGITGCLFQVVQKHCELTIPGLRDYSVHMQGMNHGINGCLIRIAPAHCEYFTVNHTRSKILQCAYARDEAWDHWVPAPAHCA
jgi:hypothetical protein